MKKTNKKGFTLTELIVVIVIIGILAGVLIPSITGYVKKSQESAALQEATTFKEPFETWLAENDNLTFNDGDATKQAADALKAFKEYCTTELDMTAEAVAEITAVTVDENGVPATYTYTKGVYVFTYTHSTGKLVKTAPAA